MSYPNTTESPFSYIVKLIGLSALGMLLSQLISYSILNYLYDIPSNTSLLEIAKNDPSAWNWIRLSQLLYQVFAFGLPALLIWKSYKNTFNVFQSGEKTTHPLAYFMIPLMLLSFFPLVQQMYIFNQSIELFEPLQTIIKDMEAANSELVKGMLASNSKVDIISNFLLVAVVAALIEEIYFRGVLQKILCDFIDPHKAIFISALIFSAIHMQFLGFLPRLALGIFFGYLFWRSNRLWLPILAHFLFNGIQLITFYSIGDSDKIKNIDDPLPFNIYFTLSSTLLFFTLYYIFHIVLTKKNTR